MEPCDTLLTRAGPWRLFQVGWFWELSLLPTRFIWISHRPCQEFTAGAGAGAGSSCWVGGRWGEGEVGWKGTRGRYGLCSSFLLLPAPKAALVCSPGVAERAVGTLWLACSCGKVSGSPEEPKLGPEPSQLSSSCSSTVLLSPGSPRSEPLHAQAQRALCSQRPRSVNGDVRG